MRTARFVAPMRRESQPFPLPEKPVNLLLPIASLRGADYADVDFSRLAGIGFSQIGAAKGRDDHKFSV